jgi:hypothetical protein
MILSGGGPRPPKIHPVADDFVETGIVEEIGDKSRYLESFQCNEGTGEVEEYTQ